MELFKSFGDKVAFHKQRSQRIEALADGVFAIVMTLLVLDIRTPMNGMDTEKGFAAFIVPYHSQNIYFCTFIFTGWTILGYSNQSIQSYPGIRSQ